MSMDDNTLFVCMTPFQIYFARKIIESEGLISAEILLIDLTDNEKSLNYLLEAQKTLGCKVYRYKETKKNKLTKVLNFIKFYLLNFLLKSYNDIFIASLHDKYIHIFLKTLKFNRLKSFDDGAANIHVGGMFFKNPYVVNIIRPKIVEHFTIYHGMDNVVPVEKIKNINLFWNIADSKNQSYSNVVKMFIGQPYQEFMDDYNFDLFQKIFAHMDIDFYFKHPREKYEYQNVEYVDSDDIFEVYLEQYLSQNPDTKVEIYSFFSSVVFNVPRNDRIKLICFTTDELYNKYKSLYDLMRELNIDVHYKYLININDVEKSC